MAIRDQILQLLQTQRLAVIATPSEGHPYANLVAFIHDPELKWIAFATLKDTRKFRNMLADPRISILIDNRRNEPDDLENAVTVTALGTAGTEHEGSDLRERLMARHPGLRSFLDDPRCGIIRIQIREYIFVSNFQETEIFSP